MTTTTSNKNPTPAREPRQRFSDRLEYRRGKRDAQCGRAPACFAAQYMAGYTAGRRESTSRGPARAKR